MAHRPQTETYENPFDKRTVPDEQEETPGAGIRVNGDDDNSNSTADRTDTTVTGENDLIEVILDAAPPASSGFKYVLKRSNGNIKVWNSQTKGTAWLDANDETNLTFSTTPMTVWVENPNGDDADLELQAKTDSGTVVCSDKVHFYDFTSVVIAIGGENQVPTDPADANHGAFAIAIELYERGYDVHMFDEDQLEGAIFEEASEAIRFRQIQRVAIFGYSHGGGATHDLAEALGNDPNVGPFTLSYTAYIDAVAEPGPFAETRRPPNSQFHVNYYQPNWNPFHGAPMAPPGSNFEMNVTTNSWGAGLTHVTIDDHPNVRNGVRDMLIGHIVPW